MPDSSDFRFERDLLAVLRENSVSALNIQNRSCQVSTEVQVGTCIPDLLIIASESDPSTARLKLSYFDCMIATATMRTGVATAEELASATFAPLDEIQRRVARLVRIGLLIHKSETHVRVSNRALPSRPRVVAVEAKLSRWKDALGQAREYLAFANEAYVAMPAQNVRRNIAALTACAEAGIGVLAVDAGDVSVVLLAERQQPLSAEWFRVVSSATALPRRQPLEKLAENASCQAR